MRHELTLYNTLTRSKERFAPIDPANVRVYACGPTVYDYAHIGNARPIIVFDVLFRVLRHVYGDGAVTYVRNITDVDDKINARAASEHPGMPLNAAIAEVTRRTEAQFKEDVRALACLEPSVEPRATEHIGEMRDIIERLIRRGVAYVADGHVLFSVAAMDAMPGVPRYGSLARRPREEMFAGARVEVADYKRDPMDFVLWKPSGAGEPGWESPGGIQAPGRPGWHIECSAMSWRHLIERFAGRISCAEADRDVFDIHAGGIDLVFPHHENEIAQSCCAFGSARMANVWMHNGFLQVDGAKMSKSDGNFVTIRDLLAGEAFGGRAWPGQVLRLAMLKTHYRQPIDWTARALEEAEENIRAWHAVEGVGAEAVEGADDEVPETLLRALCDDLNVSEAIAGMHRLAKAGQGGALAACLRFLGLHAPAVFARAAGAPEIALELREAVEGLVEARRLARAGRDFAESDRLRDELSRLGVVISDNRDGTTSWDVVPVRAKG